MARPMKLLTKALEKQLPPLYTTQDNTDPVGIVKYFMPMSGYTWYATEYDPVNRIFFGLVDGHYLEWGYFSLDELETVRNPFGMPIERDKYWKPTKLSKIIKERTQ